MAKRKHYIVRNLADPSEEPKLYRAAYASLEEAETQFDHDIEHNMPVVRIEDAKGTTVREA
jgi:hypothetical protein